MPKKPAFQIGAWAFLIGVLVAVIVGAVPGIVLSGALAITLVVIGLIIGLLNVADKEVTPFLLAAVSLVIVSTFGSAALAVIPTVSNILGALLMLFVPATVIVALKEVFSIARR